MYSLNLLQDFSNHLEKNDRSKLTIKNYSFDLKQFLEWYEERNSETFNAENLTPMDCRLYKEYLQDRGLKPKTINRRMTSLKLFFQWIYKNRKDFTFFPMPKPVRETQTPPKWLDRNEQNALLRLVHRQDINSRDAAIVKILLNTGLRVGELCALVWQDVKLSTRSGTLTVRAGKGQKYRKIPLNREAREAFTSLGYYNHTGSDQNVLAGQRGSLTPRGVQLVLKRLLRASEMNISPHTLRHTFCKNLVNAGIGLEQVALLAGHESLDVTKIYCQPSFSELSKAVEKIST